MRPSLSDAKATPAVAFCFFANHVLDGAPWARERLVRFAGRTLEFRAALFPPVLVAITAQGRLEPSSAESADARVVLAPGPRISGDAELAAELQELARTLRWDVEEDLSRVLGDVLAHRAAETARALWRWQGDAAGRIGEALVAYASDEARMVVRHPELSSLAESLAQLSRSLAELEQRVARLG